MKTPLQSLIDELEPILKSNQFDFSYKAGINSDISKARIRLEIEKQQIIDAWEDGNRNFEKSRRLGAIEYYTETYKSHE